MQEVIPDETEIKLKVSGREEHYLVSLDSRITSVKNESILSIKKTLRNKHGRNPRRNLSKNTAHQIIMGKTKKLNLFYSKTYYSIPFFRFAFNNIRYR
jgi:NAD+ kinase